MTVSVGLKSILRFCSTVNSCSPALNLNLNLNLHLTRRPLFHLRLAHQPFNSTPSAPFFMKNHSPFHLERQVAIAAVLQASRVAQTIFEALIRPNLSNQHSVSNLNQQTSITKIDKSPVTVGDYTVQALINYLLSQYFPDDEIVGEEDSSELASSGSQRHHMSQIMDFANKSLKADRLASPVDESIWTKYRDPTIGAEDGLLKLIDRGNGSGGGVGKRFWTLDPIDGTKGFLRGGQYAVCLALVVDGVVVLGVVGTPNLPVAGAPTGSPANGPGVLFVAERGQGAFQRPLDAAAYSPIKMVARSSDTLAAHGTFCESFEAAHSDHSLTAAIAARLGIPSGRAPLRIDSQAKYCALARGDGDLYFRFPTRPGYEEKIWDHAAGSLLVTEAGGAVTDLDGKPLDFSRGRTLAGNHQGFLACHSLVYPLVLDAVQDVYKQKEKS